MYSGYTGSDLVVHTTLENGDASMSMAFGEFALQMAILA